MRILIQVLELKGGWEDVVIDGNIVHDCASGGILIGANSGRPTTNVKITNNICYDNGKSLQTNSHQRAGIALHEGSDNRTNLSSIIIENNRCYDDDAESQLHGVAMNFAQSCIVRNNDVRGNEGPAIVALVVLVLLL